MSQGRSGRQRCLHFVYDCIFRYLLTFLKLKVLFTRERCVRREMDNQLERDVEITLEEYS
jgi:hypothetical protein